MTLALLELVLISIPHQKLRSICRGLLSPSCRSRFGCLNQSLCSPTFRRFLKCHFAFDISVIDSECGYRLSLINLVCACYCAAGNENHFTNVNFLLRSQRWVLRFIGSPEHLRIGYSCINSTIFQRLKLLSSLFGEKVWTLAQVSAISKCILQFSSYLSTPPKSLDLDWDYRIELTLSHWDSFRLFID